MPAGTTTRPQIDEDFEVKLGEVKSGFDAIPPNEYEATIFGRPEARPSANSGQPTLYLVYKIREGEFKGRQLFGNFSLQDGSAWRLQEVLGRLGMPDFNKNQKLSAIKDFLQGKDVKIVVTSRLDDRPEAPKNPDGTAKTVNDVADVFAPGATTAPSGKKELF